MDCCAVSPVSISAPPDMQIPATISGIRGPRMLIIRPDSGAKTTVTAASGSVSSPACSAE